MDFKVIWRKEGDNFARTMNRFDEIWESISLIKTGYRKSATR